LRRRGRIKQSEKSAAVKIIKQRYGSTAQIILGTASGMLSALLTEGVCLHSERAGFHGALSPFFLLYSFLFILFSLNVPSVNRTLPTI
jgi:hypothetical protein